MIPRDLFDNNLDAFAKELGFINRLIQDVSEGVTGTRETPQVESLSSSIPTISLETAVPVVTVLALIVKKFLDAWEQIEKIRKLRNELTEIGLKGTAVEELSEQVTTTVEEIVEESTDLVLKNYDTHDGGRKNELRNAVSTDVRRLFGQIERGLTIEFRAEPPSDPDDETAKALTTINDVGTVLKFPPPAREPLLLTAPEILEGELHKRTYKKTSTTKTTSTTKKSSKGPTDEKA